MIKLGGLCVSLVFAIGCGNANDAGGKPGAESKPAKEGAADLDALAKLKDELCACKDAACGDAVRTKLEAKLKSMDAEYASSRNKNIMHHAMEAQEAARECLYKLK
jgi:hypothetical protein